MGTANWEGERQEEVTEIGVFIHSFFFGYLIEPALLSFKKPCSSFADFIRALTVVDVISASLVAVVATRSRAAIVTGGFLRTMLHHRG